MVSKSMMYHKRICPLLITTPSTFIGERGSQDWSLLSIFNFCKKIFLSIMALLYQYKFKWSFGIILEKCQSMHNASIAKVAPVKAVIHKQKVVGLFCIPHRKVVRHLLCHERSLVTHWSVSKADKWESKWERSHEAAQKRIHEDTRCQWGLLT